MENGMLVLGPFQGKVACIEIQVGRGVCGMVAEDRTQLVYDVHQFPGHIACDRVSNSEIAIPIHAGGQIVGVLDIDSPSICARSLVFVPFCRDWTHRRLLWHNKEKAENP